MKLNFLRTGHYVCIIIKHTSAVFFLSMFDQFCRAIQQNKQIEQLRQLWKRKNVGKMALSIRIKKITCILYRPQ